MNLVDWLRGTARATSPSVHFEVVDAGEVARDHPDLVSELARRLMDAKISRSYLEAYGAQLGWDIVGRRLRTTKPKVYRGDFGEVVATGWLVDYLGLQAPIRKLRTQIDAGQTLPGIDNLAFEVVGGVVERLHVLESKLRTTSAFLTTVGVEAYGQLLKDRQQRALDLLEFGLEQLHVARSPLAPLFADYILRRRDTEEDDDNHEIVLVIETSAWDEEVLTEMNTAITDALPNCRVHVLLVANLATLIAEVFDAAGLDLLNEGADDE